MDISTEFNQCAFFLISSDPSSSRPRNETLPMVVHFIPDDLYGNSPLVRTFAPVTVDQLVLFCRLNARTTKIVDVQNSSLLCKFSIFGDEDTR